ncbi:hypothetical protein HY486_04675 [Candidatus Woesearchaeota archaeon]|nr:hypothetical protein [Candidatus Woesearchaeota archaeon]
MSSELIELYVKLCDKYNEAHLPVLSSDDIPSGPDWTIAEPVINLTRPERRSSILNSLKSHFSIEKSAKSRQTGISRDILLFLLKDRFNI